MAVTFYRAEVSNDQGKTQEGGRFYNGAEAQHWALQVMPDASKLVLRVIPQGQTRGWYARKGGVGPWIDVDMWEKSV
ncbi:MAG: hypothetical protein WCO82_04320 [Sphingomonadales bacterium]|jgi:hypothetical protein